MNSVIVVGGGIIGMLSALELLRSGFTVSLVDRQPFGRESSWAGGGIISPLFPWRYPDPISHLARASQQIYPQLIAELSEATGIDPEFLPSGMLALGDYPDEEPLVWARRLGIDMQPVERDRIEQIEPGTAEQYSRGFWFPSVHQVRNPRLVRLVTSYLQQTPVKCYPNHEVSRLLVEQQRALGVQFASGDRLHADAVVIAGGAWTGQLLQDYPIDVSIRPIKGQMLIIHAKPGVVQRITLAQDRYLIPRADGRVLVGSTTEDKGFDKTIDDEVRDALCQFAVDTIPALGDYPVEHHWSGLRPGSSQGIPVIAQHPVVSRLYINAGHYRNGLVMAPASARLLAQIVGRQTPILDPLDYLAANPVKVARKQSTPRG
jgi:glycine oxidase